MATKGSENNSPVWDFCFVRSFGSIQSYLNQFLIKQEYYQGEKLKMNAITGEIDFVIQQMAVSLADLFHCLLSLQR